MSKRSRKSDNSKRPQPIQQQRAQAHQPGPSGPAKADPDAQQRSKPGKEDTGDKQR